MSEDSLEQLKRLPHWITGEGPEPYRPYVALWVARRADKVHLGQPCRPEQRSLAMAATSLAAGRSTPAPPAGPSRSGEIASQERARKTPQEASMRRQAGDVHFGGAALGPLPT